MKEKQRFLLVFLLTILITRIIVFFIPRTSFIYTDQFHHSYFGFMLLIVYIFIKNYYLLAVSLGLIIDQITQAPFYIAHLIGKGLAQPSFWAYWSSYTLISTLIAVIISVLIIWKYKK